MRRGIQKVNIGARELNERCPNTARRKVPHLLHPLTVGELTHIADNIDAIRSCCEWILNYLAQPHGDLGRSGNVCPFAAPAITKDTLRIAVVRLSDAMDRKTQITDAITEYRHAFLCLGGSHDIQILQAMLILFPDVQPHEASDLIDASKEELKASFVEQGLMLGEFHANNQSPGLHNPAFKPLRSDIPMLAIRRMVATDYVFLDRADYDAETRLQYLERYLKVAVIADSKRKELERTVAFLRAQLCPRLSA